eukprot:scpid97104/ scgid3613/ 
MADNSEESAFFESRSNTRSWRLASESSAADNGAARGSSSDADDGRGHERSRRRTWLDSGSVAKMRERLHVQFSARDDSSKCASVFSDFPSGAGSSAAFALLNDPAPDLACPVDGLSFSAYAPVVKEPTSPNPHHVEDFLQGDISPRSPGEASHKKHLLVRRPTYMQYDEVEKCLDYQKIDLIQPDDCDEVSGLRERNNELHGY